MEVLEVLKRCKRTSENYLTYRRTFLLIIVIFGLFLYIGPDFIRYITHSKSNGQDVTEKCIHDRLVSYYFDAEEFNANIQHNPLSKDEKPYLPYIGNGVFGLSLHYDSPLYIRNGRGLSLPVFWHPIIPVMSKSKPREAVVLHYLTGVAHKFQCFSSGQYVSYQYYAHRKLPSVLVQSIKITNPTDETISMDLGQMRLSKWPTAVSHVVNIQHDVGEHEYQVITGSIEVPSSDDVIAVSLVSRKTPKTIEVEARSTLTLEILTTVNYSKPSTQSDYAKNKDIVEKNAIENMKKAILKVQTLKEDHIKIWQQLWSTGFTISYSKAVDAINGDKINATMFYVLSQVPSPYHDETTPYEKKMELANSLFYAEGCYSGYHTLQAVNLWKDLSTMDEVNAVVSLWLITLEKQGCHNLLKAGAIGVVQAMVLSFGGLRFSNQHLEFNIHPKYLHRDYYFRRISYGNLTHVNVSVLVQEDNKAVVYVALDRSDKSYYACDGGCLDDPVQLGPERKLFPVKLTEPVTAILYITYDRQHMEDLRHAIHVKEIIEAPAHEHHVIALHKHGHHLGGLPTLFWVSICFLIVIFHLFLFKLIYNEYCGTQDKYRTRYGKL